MGCGAEPRRNARSAGSPHFRRATSRPLGMPQNRGKDLNMRKLCFVVLGAMLASGPVLAQPAPQPTTKPPAHQAAAAKTTNTQNVNAAYMGGG